MNVLLPILFATLAAVGNGIFAYGQKQSLGITNPMVYISGSVLTAAFLATFLAPFTGTISLPTLRANAVPLLVSGAGLWLTYVGFNLMYRYGASYYVVYAAVSIVTTTAVVGFLIYKEPMNGYHKAALVAALATVVLFSLGQSKA